MDSTRLLAVLPAHITLDWIRAQCEEEADCWLWQGHCQQLGYPDVYLDRIERYVMARRVVAALSGHEFLHSQPVATRCGCKTCLNPAHVHPSTTSAIGRKAARSGAWSGRDRAAKISAARLARSTISDEAVLAVRMAPHGTLQAVAAEHGVNYHTARAIRTGRIRKDYSSPWAGMGARR